MNRQNSFHNLINSIPLIAICLCVCLNSTYGQSSKTKYEYSTPELEAAEKLYKDKAYPEALAAFESIIEKAKAAENYEEVVYAMEKRALSLRRLGRIEEAVPLMDKAIKLAKEKLPPDHLLISKMYYTRGTMEHRLQSFYIARSYFDTAMVRYQKADTYDSTMLYRIIEYKHFAYYYSEGSLDTITLYLDKLFALEQIKQKKTYNPDKILNLFQAYTMTFHQQGNISKALLYGIRAYRYVKSNQEGISNRRIAETLYFLALTLYYQKDYQSALKILQEATPIFENTPRNKMPEYFSFHNLFGITLKATKDYENSLEHLKKAEKIPLKGLSQHEFLSRSKFRNQILRNIASFFGDQGDQKKKKQFLIEGLTLSKKTFPGRHNYHAPLYSSLGGYSFDNQMWPQALALYDSALRNGLKDYTGSLLSFPSVDNAFSYDDLRTLKGKASNLLMAALDKDDPLPMIMAAEDYANQTHQLLLDNKEDYFAADGKLNVSSDFKSLYATGVSAAFELFNRTGDQKYLDKALNHMARGKSQLFLEQLGNLQLLKDRAVPQSIRQEFALASQKIDSLDIEVNTLLNIDPLDDRLPGVLEEKVVWNYRLNELKEEVSAIVKNPEPIISVKSIREQFQLSGNKVFVEYLESDSTLFALAITDEKVSFKKIEKDKAFDQALEGLVVEVSSAPQGDHQGHLDRFAKNGDLLYQRLITPITEEFGSINELIIVPDGKLTKLPFGLLVDNWKKTETSFKQLNYLMKEVSLTHLLSSQVGFQDDRASSGKGILGFGYVGEGITDERAEMGNLPGALKEIDFLKSKFDGDFFTGEKGTKQRFLQEADDYDIIHLAIHGKSDSVNRFKSSLVFNGDQDYYLTSTDLYQTNLKSKLAVLSACETGVGQFSKGEGAFSIARGFAVAGVPAIVTTLWKVNDAAGAKINQAFYQGMEKGLNKDQALKQAKLSFLEQSNNITESPFYWGNYVLIGDTKPIQIASKRSLENWQIAFGTILLLVVLIALMIRRKSIYNISH